MSHVNVSICLWHWPLRILVILFVFGLESFHAIFWQHYCLLYVFISAIWELWALSVQTHACLSTCGSFNGYESPEHWRMVKTQETHFNVTLQTLYSLFQSLDHHNLLCWEIFWSYHQLYDLQIILYDKYLMILHYFLKYVT